MRAATTGALIVALFAFALAVALGNWQQRRAEAKLELQAAWDRAALDEPSAPTGADFDRIGERLPQRLRLHGRFLFEHELWLDNRRMNGEAGRMLITPLRLADGAVVLVNRGFVRRDPQDRLRLPDVVRPGKPVLVEGLAVAQPGRVLQIGENVSAGGGAPALWQNLDFDAFERMSGLSVPRWVLQQTGGEVDGLRRNWPRLDAGAERHRGYALQWYSLAALIAVLTFYLAARRWRRAKRTSGPDDD